MNILSSSSHLIPPLPAAVDLQIHSKYSDGRWTLQEICQAVSDKRLAFAALTEHDLLTPQSRLDHLSENSGCHFIPATEITCQFEGRYVDLLCYGATVTAPAINVLNCTLWERQLDNSVSVRDALVAGGYLRSAADLSRETLSALATSQMPGRLRDSLRSDLGDATAQLALLKRHGYRLQAHDAATAAKACAADGWFSLLGHPGAAKPGHPPLSLRDVTTLQERIGFDGLEAHSPFHTADQTRLYETHCIRNGLLCAAGSDSHGPDEALGTWPISTVRALLDRLERVLA